MVAGAGLEPDLGGHFHDIVGEPIDGLDPREEVSIVHRCPQSTAEVTADRLPVSGQCRCASHPSRLQCPAGYIESGAHHHR